MNVGTVSEWGWEGSGASSPEKRFTISAAESALTVKLKCEGLISGVISERIKTIQNVC